jgi:hypothetical protein
MNRIALGVHVHAQPERLRATLAGLRQLPDEGALGPAAASRALHREYRKTGAACPLPRSGA